MDLVSVFFGLVVLCWVLFFVLEGFDFGVGLLAPLLGRDDRERGAILRTVGPFWDGNEVWLVAAIGITFAAFPAWYAALLAGLYLPMVALLLLLAGRGAALEFRGKGPGARWRRGCDVVVAACSAGIALLCGALLATFVRGLAIGENHEVAGAGLGRSLAPLATPAAVLGALVALWAVLGLGAAFLALRTTGPVRGRARRLTTRLAAGAAVAGCLAIASGGIGAPRGVSLSVVVLAVGVALAARRGREALAFGGAVLGVAGGVAAALTANGSVVLPSTVDRAWSLTMAGAAAPAQTLRLLGIVGVVVLPGVLVYQAYSYWVFRSRVTTAPVSTAPASTAPASTAPASTAPASTAPASTAPASTAPASTAPASTAPASTAPVPIARVTTARANAARVATTRSGEAGSGVGQPGIAECAGGRRSGSAVDEGDESAGTRVVGESTTGDQVES